MLSKKPPQNHKDNKIPVLLQYTVENKREILGNVHGDCQ